MVYVRFRVWGLGFRAEGLGFRALAGSNLSNQAIFSE